MDNKKNLDKSQFPISEIKVAGQNDNLYEQFMAINHDDRSLVESIKERGILEPLVISSDQVLLSGHRRLSAARYLKHVSVPVRIHDVKYRSLSQADKHLLLSEFNQQRDKSAEEKINEALVRTDPIMASEEIKWRKLERKLSTQTVSNLDLGSRKKRHSITTTQFLDAVVTSIDKYKKYWPLTDRRIHYLLLNAPPLRHNKKLNSAYRNDKSSYKALTNLLTRARLTGAIPMRAIEDSTRPVQLAGGFDSVQEYIGSEMQNFLIGYRRDLQKGQPNHIEIILEKNALRTVIEEVADEYGIPLTTARGYLSLPPKAEIYERFKRSGKETLVLLMLTDFDPDGEEIAASTARSLRDDFGIPGQKIIAVKVALTVDDINENDLPSDMEAKVSSPNYKKFFTKYGAQRVVELDAAPVELLQEKLRESIEEHLDIDEFNRQQEIQADDNRQIVARREVIFNTLGISKTGSSPSFGV
jgi:hypothetical protein